MASERSDDDIPDTPLPGARVTSQRVLVACALALAALGGVSVALWNVGAMERLLPRPTFAPIQYNTALAFLALAGGLLAALAARRTMALALAGLAAFIGVATLAAHAGVLPGVEAWFRSPFIHVGAAPERTSLMAAMCLLFAAVGALLSVGIGGATPRRWHLAIDVGAGVLLSLGLVALGSYVAGLTGAFELAQIRRLSVPTSLGIGLCGLALLALRRREAGYGPPLAEQSWIPLAIGFFGVAGSLLVSRTLAATNIRGTREQVAAFVLVGGGLLSLLAAAAVRLAQVARRRSRQAQHAYRRLLAETTARREAEASAMLYSGAAREMQLALCVVRVPSDQPASASEVLVVNPAGAALAGLRMAEVHGRTLSEAFPLFRPTGLAAACTEVVRDSAPVRCTVRVGEDDDHWFECRLFPLPDRCVGILLEDISPRRTAEQALRASEQRYRLLFALNPLPMWVYDSETFRFLAVNDAAVVQYGWSEDEFLTMTILDIRPPEDVQRLLSVDIPAARSIMHARTWRHLRKDGSELLVQIASHAISFAGRPARVILALDVTERLRLEEQLRQTGKMEAVGQLAGGVAHDFNNILTAILGNAAFLLEDLAPGDARRDDVLEIERAAERAADLTRRLLTFSRHQLVVPDVLDLNVALGDVEKLLRRLLPANIRLELRPGIELGRVRADAGQIEQVIMNLVVNARDAMVDGGAIGIETMDMVVDAPRAPLHPGVLPGRYVVLTVRDTGHGMDAATRARIFEPFFTTKAPGRGTGLGLSVVHGIVRQGSGFLSVESEPGRGSIFRVYFPRVEDEAASRTAVDDSFDPHGSEAVLLCEEQAEVRHLAERALRGLGYTVLAAGRARDALHILESRETRVDLLITDILLPDRSGRGLAERARQLRPGLPVLFMSGYSEEESASTAAGLDGMQFLPKPFTPFALGRMVRQALDGTIRMSGSWRAATGEPDEAAMPDDARDAADPA